MGIILSKGNRLYWLGRYNERVYTSLKYAIKLYDQAIDGDEPDYENICKRLNIPQVYSSSEDFFKRYIFDISIQDSIAHNAEMMLENGMLLRETLSSETLSYLQMAVNALGLASQSKSPAFELQWVLDDIMAFRGSYEDFIIDETLRNIIKAGISVERISMYERLSINKKESASELKKLINRMYKTKLPINEASRKIIEGHASNGIEAAGDMLLYSVESLFII